MFADLSPLRDINRSIDRLLSGEPESNFSGNIKNYCNLLIFNQLMCCIFVSGKS